MTRTKIRTRDHQSTSREAENTTRAIDHWATREIYWLHLHMVLWRWPQSSSNPVSFVALRCLLLPPVFSQRIPFLKWILYTGVGNGPRPVIYSAPPVRVDSARTLQNNCIKWETYLFLFNMGHMIYALDQFFNVNSIVVSIVWSD